MKQKNESSNRCTGNSHARPHANSLKAITGVFAIFTFIILLASCKKDDVAQESRLEAAAKSIVAPGGNVLNSYPGLPAQTRWELQQARAATAKYLNFDNAIKDGYADINVVLPNMGYHYMKVNEVDGEFDFRKPEILVYNMNPDGTMQLVAVEYAVPLSYPEPEGFTGNHDVWTHHTGFGLWLLHAWVWYENPDGVFNPTNSTIHLH